MGGKKAWVGVDRRCSNISTTAIHLKCVLANSYSQCRRRKTYPPTLHLKACLARENLPTQRIDLTSATPPQGTSDAHKLYRAVLDKAISSAQPERLRVALSAICKETLEARRIASRLWFTDPSRSNKRRRLDIDVARKMISLMEGVGESGSDEDDNCGDSETERIRVTLANISICNLRNAVDRSSA